MTPTRQLPPWATSAWLAPIPAVVVHALVLLFSDRIWSDMATVHSRTGDTSQIPVAERQLILLAIPCAFYWLTVAFGSNMFDGRGSWRLRPPTLGERTVAMWMVRLGTLAMMYGVTFWTLKAYVLG